MSEHKEEISTFSALDLYFSEFLLKKAAISDESVKYAIAFLFFQSKQGHLCVQFKNNTIIPSKPFSENFLSLIKNGFSKLSEFIREKKIKAIIESKNSFYLHKNWVIESKIVSEIERLQVGQPLLLNNDTFEKKAKHLLDATLITNEQYLLFEKCIRQPLVFLSGGPGSGKTYTAARLLEAIAIALPNLKVIITAPTGKAVSNLQEKIATLKLEFDYQVKTMHSLLKLQALREARFCDFKLDSDLIIIDESSMIDAPLLALFLSAIKDRTSVIFMGDENQLPPVEGGSPFVDIVKARKDLCVFFKRCHRFKNSNLADALKNNNCNEFITAIKSKNIYQEILFDNLIQVVNFEITALVEKHLVIHDIKEINPILALNKFNKFRILGCVRQGNFGVDAINYALYSFFSKKFFKYNFAYPILIAENNFQMKLFNGITGVMIKEKSEENAYFMIDNQLKKFPKLALPKYEIGFAISVHKSQGSEYDDIYIIMAPGSENLGKQVLYTAITRAKESVKIMGPLSIIEATIKNFEAKNSQISRRLKI